MPIFALKMDYHNIAMKKKLLYTTQNQSNAQSGLSISPELLEQFLVNLYKKLNDMQLLLNLQSENTHANLKNNLEMDTSLRSGLQEIQLNTFGHLEKTIQQKLSELTTTLDHFQEMERTRIEEAEARTHEISEKLKQTEFESQDLKEQLIVQSQLARKDALTGLPNRAAYNDKFQQELASLQKEGGKLFIAVADLDNFKTINDTYGHLVGDKVLVQTAKVLRKGLRLNDFVGRYGGEEFVVFIRDKTALEARAMIEKIRTTLENTPFYFKDRENRVIITLSFGITEVQVTETPEQAFQRADDALYVAKKTKNVSVYTAPYDAQ
jgi:diguanylate cyclase